MSRPRDQLPADYRARDAASMLAAMHALVPSLLPEWRDHANEADFGNVLLELFAHVGDVLGYYQDRVADESLLGTARSRRSVIDHLRLIGYQLGTAAPAAARLVVSVPGATTASVVVEPGAAFATVSAPGVPSVRFEYAGDPLTIDFSAVAADPATGRRTAAFPVEEGTRYARELIGVGDGTPDQRLPLPHAPVILRPAGSGRPGGGDVALVTVEDGALVPWLPRDTLAFSMGDERHFLVEIDADDQATVVFGDGVTGAAPPADAEVRATYRVGGGRAGNVAACAITTIVDAAPLALLGATVANPEPATGGDDRETAEHAVGHAPSVFRSLGRAVTAADYEALALTFEGVGKVRAQSSGGNTVTLRLAPAGGGKVSDVLELGLKAYFEDKRMLGQIVEVEDVDYVPIRIAMTLAVAGYYAPDEVANDVRRAVAGLLAFDTVTFGQPVYLSAVYEKAQEVPGVVYLTVDAFGRAGGGSSAGEPPGLVVLAPNELPVLAEDGLTIVLAGAGA